VIRLRILEVQDAEYPLRDAVAVGGFGVRSHGGSIPPLQGTRTHGFRALFWALGA
jgi:hypothetical protein